jgi:hypothetical protein
MVRAKNENDNSQLPKIIFEKLPIPVTDKIETRTVKTSENKNESDLTLF